MMSMKSIFIIIYLFLNLMVSAEEVRVKTDNVLKLDKPKDASFDKEGVDVVYYVDTLILENDSILIIPNHPDKKVKVLIKNLTVIGEAYIFQSDNEPSARLDYIKVGYPLNALPKGKFGKNGVAISPESATSGDGDNGIRGNDGENGSDGQNLAKLLILDLTINRIGKLNIVQLPISGGNGGNGSNGQHGSDSNCERANHGGNGGNGGNAGVGGKPGAIGDLIVRWSSSTKIPKIGIYPSNINVIKHPSYYGNFGEPGKGGNGGLGRKCWPIRDRLEGNPGAHGNIGFTGDFPLEIGNLGNVKFEEVLR